jgi:hypothetical protein
MKNLAQNKKENKKKHFEVIEIIHATQEQGRYI